MAKHPLSNYVIAVIAIIIILNIVVYFVFGKEKFLDVSKFSLGFLLGMLAMYIAVHIYSWR